MVVHCLFEQSGTFRDEFRKLGFEAYDYDIDNQFGKTDYQIDLFNEIEKASERENSIFDNFTSDDLIIAFFPCTRFSAMNMCVFDERNTNFRKLNKIEILERCKSYNEEQSYLYGLVCNLFTVALRNDLKFIMENPYVQPHFLTLYFPIKPKVIDMNRKILGDTVCKPTQYWFININPKNNHVNTNKEFHFGGKKTLYNRKIMNEPYGIKRSLISSKYAENFIKKYILEEREVMLNETVD